ncbi:MAG: hypothetical protein FWC90_02845 [Oscillospiraceae bacterium]|nr:hypothetical protein [Oscillospiraceae bacterium]
MASVKIKKIRMLVSCADKNALLKELMHLGCVEVSAPGDLHPEHELIQTQNAKEMAQLKADYAALTHGLDILKKYSKAKRAASKQKLDKHTLLDGSETERCLETARKLIALDAQGYELSANEKSARSFIESLKPWTLLDIPLDYAGTQSTRLLRGTISADCEADSAQVEEAIYKAVPESQIFVVSSDKTWHYIAIICLREKLPELSEVLRGFDFVPASIKPTAGMAAEHIESAERELDAIDKAREEILSQISEMVAQSADIERCCDHIDAKITLTDAASKLCVTTESSLMLTGWMAASAEEKLIVALSKYKCAWEITVPSPEDLDEVPVKGRFYRGGGRPFMPLEIKTKYVDIIREET